MKLLLAALAMVAFTASSASADLALLITGVAGSGVTTWEFTTISVGATSGPGTVRDNTADSWSTGDTTQFGGSDGILNALIQNQIFAISAGATLTVGASTENITAIFLDDDGVGAGDDLGVRVANPIAYALADSVSWAGSGTVAGLDINDLVQGSYQMNFGATWLLDQDNAVVTIGAVSIPEPTSLAIIGVAAIGLVVRRRQR